MIYAIEAIGTQFVKIGISKNVGKRLIELQNGMPMDLNILALADWPHEEERRLHIYLESSWQRGEWFRRTKEVSAIIELMKSPDGFVQWAALRGVIGERMDRTPDDTKRIPRPVGGRSRAANAPDFASSSLAARMRANG